jgi:hypothetical protein
MSLPAFPEAQRAEDAIKIILKRLFGLVGKYGELAKLGPPGWSSTGPRARVRTGMNVIPATVE